MTHSPFNTSSNFRNRFLFSELIGSYLLTVKFEALLTSKIVVPTGAVVFVMT